MPIPLARRLDPLVERMLARMEQPVRPRDHLRTVDHLRPWLVKHLQEVSSEDRDVALRAKSFIASPANGPNDFAARCEAIGDWPLFGSSAATISPDDWFQRGRILPGGANALRKMLRDDDLAGPLAQRLMRRVEVTRTICVCENGLSADELLLEKANVCLSLVESCQRLRDIRYLNTALKATDWLWKDMRRLHRRSPSPARVWAGLMYVYLVYWQQEQLARL